MTTRQRLAKIEAGLDPDDVVLLVLDEMHQYTGLIEYARAIGEAPVSDAPITRIAERVDARVRAAMKGQPREAVARAARGAIDEAILRFVLVLVINQAAQDTARVESLRATSLVFYLGMLIGEGDDPDDAEVGPRLAHWRQWAVGVDAVARHVRRDEEAREILERRYLGGRSSLLPDAVEAWAAFREPVDLLIRMAQRNDLANVILGGHDVPAVPTLPSPEDEAAYLLDLARIRTFESLGDRMSAVAIMERRLRR